MTFVAILYSLSKLMESFVERTISSSFVNLLRLDHRNKGCALRLRVCGGCKLQKQVVHRCHCIPESWTPIS